ncbi:MAG: phenylphosphate carboxylase subunit delta [Deltaproteobacteria bacterium]|nr:MAG: phenylphosphate carboxylase subunit delta [Deltaproteobacteria bacterium]
MPPIPGTIRLLLLDVDGVLTDGSLLFSEAGETIKRFHVRDGLGIRMLQEAGIAVGVITGRKSAAVAARCQDLGITRVYQGVKDKAALIPELENATGVPATDMAFLGDDLIDMAIMKQVGFSAAVADAHPRVRRTANWVTRLPGGHGAVRELAEALLKAGGKWEKICRRYGGGAA